MLILLDCRPLQAAGPDSERSRLIFSAAAALSASDGVEWLMVADQRFRSGQFPALPGRVVIRRALPGRLGWRCWYDRQLPRLATQMGVQRAWLTAGVTGGMRVPVCLWVPDRANPAEGVGVRGPAALYKRRLTRVWGVRRRSFVFRSGIGFGWKGSGRREKRRSACCPRLPMNRSGS